MSESIPATPESATVVPERDFVPASAPAPRAPLPRAGDAALSGKLQALHTQNLGHQFLGWLMGAPALDEIRKALISLYVVEGMLADSFELIEYVPQESISDKQLRASQLRGWNMNTGNDFFEAKYRGVSFAFSDVELSSQTGRDSYGATVFLGQWFILDLHEKISAPLLISEWETLDRIDEEIEVPLEEGLLGDTCTVRTESPDLAEQVLTPAFMAFLSNLRESSTDALFIHERQLHLFFWGRQVHIGINSRRDFFEPRENAQDIPALRAQIQGEIDFIKGIIDGLLLLEWLFPGKQ